MIGQSTKQGHVTGQGGKQGHGTGAGTKNKGNWGYMNKIECHGLSYAVMAAIDSAAGRPTGRRQHSPITIRREVDSASPQLWHSLLTNESFEVAKLVFGADGAASPVREIELRNGAIVSLRPGGIVDGKRIEYLTLSYSELTVNGLRNAIIPHQIMG